MTCASSDSLVNVNTVTGCEMSCFKHSRQLTSYLKLQNQTFHHNALGFSLYDNIMVKCYIYLFIVLYVEHFIHITQHININTLLHLTRDQTADMSGHVI